MNNGQRKKEALQLIASAIIGSLLLWLFASFMAGTFGNTGSGGSSCFIDWDGRSNSTLC